MASFLLFLKKAFLFIKTAFLLHAYHLCRALVIPLMNFMFRLDMTFPDRNILYASNAIILANHTSNWDPILLGTFIKRKVSFIASDTHFRTPYLRNVMRLLSAIPKTKGKNDIKNLRTMIDRARRGESLAIFPEGQSSWDGKTISLVKGTAKLIRLLSLPVLCFSIEGSYFASSRWMRGIRKGRVRITLRRYFDVETQKSMNLETFEKELASALQYNACTHQELYNQPYKGLFPAEYLERILFVCPNCLSQDHMKSRHTRLICKNCSHYLTYDRTGALLYSHPEEIIPALIQSMQKIMSSNDSAVTHLRLSIPDYMEAQRRYFETFLKQKKEMALDASLISSENLTLIQYRHNKNILRLSGHLYGYADQIIIHSKDFNNYSRTFPLKDISGFNIQKNEIAEFFYKTDRYQLRPPGPRFSMLRWLLFIHYFSPKSASGL